MLKLLYSYEAEDQKTFELLKTSAIIYVPIVNVDGVTQINTWFDENGKLYAVRKNRRLIESSMSGCTY